jgi:RecQ family ATP-dependent DNA helicase
LASARLPKFERVDFARPEDCPCTLVFEVVWFHNDAMGRGRKRAEKVDIDFTLRRVFGKKAFRPLQREVINATIAGHDVFLQAATSFGKSLCFQLPASIATGITVVVSPLLALMTNQINAARALGIRTESISSNIPQSERNRIVSDLKCGHPETRLLYVTPELCAMDHFRKLLNTIHTQGQLIRIAIDEVHCISEWGHDFRPAYKELSWLKKTLILPSVPIIALTATATPRVRNDIVKCLGLNPLISPTQTAGTPGKATKFFSTTTARPNIHYEVRYFSESSPKDDSGDDLFANLVSWLTSISTRRVNLLVSLSASQSQPPTPSDLTPICGIIYVPLRATAENLASRLSSSSITASAYHAGLEPATRAWIQTTFLHPPIPSVEDACTLAGSFNIIVATTAFGMGIDAPSVRFVVHYGMPRGLESFVQESGRAGRDGKAASSVVLYTREERDRVRFRVAQDVTKELNKKAGGGGSPAQRAMAQAQARSKGESLEKAIDYCEETSKCRHEIISAYFGDGEMPVCDFACDFCKEGAVGLKKRKERGLATDEAAMEFTQREPRDAVDDYDYWSQI